jgi:hypothetical protein
MSLSTSFIDSGPMTKEKFSIKLKVLQVSINESSNRISYFVRKGLQFFMIDRRLVIKYVSHSLLGMCLLVSISDVMSESSATIRTTKLSTGRYLYTKPSSMTAAAAAATAA